VNSRDSDFSAIGHFGEFMPLLDQ